MRNYLLYFFLIFSTTACSQLMRRLEARDLEAEKRIKAAAVKPEPATSSPAPDLTGSMSGGSAGGRLDISYLQGMMDECRALRQNAVTCRQHVLERCEVDLNPADCRQVLRNMEKEFGD